MGPLKRGELFLTLGVYIIVGCCLVYGYCKEVQDQELVMECDGSAML